MLTQVTPDEYHMATPKVSLNEAIGTTLERVKEFLQDEQREIAKAGKLAVPVAYITSGIVLASAVERLNQDLLQRDNTINLKKYSDLYDLEDNIHAYISVYLTDETLSTVGKVARQISSQAPQLTLRHRGKINVKKVTSIALYYVDDTYVK